MKKLSKILCLCSVLFLASCDYIIPSTWNYRITVEIDTPEGVKSGSAVRQVRAWKNIARWLNPDVRSVKFRVIGEAVVIDLEGEGILFYLNGWDSNSIVSNAFPSKERDLWKQVEFYSNLEIGKKVVQTGWSSFAWLKSLDGNENLQRLDSKDFNKAFGDEVKLIRTVIEITDDPVSWRIEPLLKIILARLGSYRNASFQNKE